MECSLNFLEEISSFPFYCFAPFLCIVHLRRLSCLSLLVSETLHSDEYIFPFLLCLLLLFFPQLFVSLPRQPVCLPPFLFLGGGLATVSCVMLCTSIHSSSDRIWFRPYLNFIVVFPTFFSLRFTFAIKTSWSEQLSAPGLVFADYIVCPSLAAKNIINLVSYWPSDAVQV